MIVMRRTRPSGHASLDFVNILENASHEFGTNLDVKSDMYSNDATFNASYSGSAIEYSIGDDNCGGDINIIQCVIIK